ncbi:YqaJ-like viral recombinase domain protein (plasmid) [Candidatus Bealeia paramacronuclearis]|uniref:YqaJ-like viral recombinase domain protein n=1 Tax=Candidatus Bealeia paramacronuclearis TaxID=1921001 RepID=A0ABZ2C9R3_9PROT|nr:hypothetical protein [Candidatus Bealeia paramacronuclearis]
MNTTIIRTTGLSKQARQERRHWIHASDVAPILGVSPFKTAYEVFIEKTMDLPELEEDSTTSQQEWGLRLEGSIIQAYRESTGYHLHIGRWPQRAQKVWKEASLPFRGTPDALVLNEKASRDPSLWQPVRGLEIKTTDAFNAKGWGLTGTRWDGSDLESCPVPYHYYIQVLSYMILFDVKAWDLAVLIGGNDYRLYHLEWHQETAELILATLKDFYNRYMRTKTEPPCDYSAPGVQTILSRLYTPQEDTEITLDDAAAAIAYEAHAMCQLSKSAADKAKALKAQLRHLMKTASLGYLPCGGRVSLTQTRDGAHRMTFRIDQGEE